MEFYQNLIKNRVEEFKKTISSKHRGQAAMGLVAVAISLVTIGILIAVNSQVISAINNSIPNATNTTQVPQTTAQAGLVDIVRETANITDYFAVVIGLAILSLVILALAPFLGGVMGGGRRGS